ncbi:spore coat protein U domain-containing protein [Deinococcus sp. RIT780]|uniref:spore coat protein U domain-containing protein n=3 Tax=unclassified Deinococcus TaxID=2623546 RepID=UPI001C89F57D|nr:spore coat U domain-containing protein [Deinococcus sp. RIT780]
MPLTSARRFLPWRRGLTLVAATLVVSTLGGGAQAAVTCLLSASPLSFGAYDATRLTPTAASAPISVSCRATSLLDPLTVPFQVSLGAGQGGSYAAQAMLGSPSGRLNYGLFTPLGARWGDGSDGTSTVGGAVLLPALLGSLGTTLLTVNGVIPAGQRPFAGTYSDAVTITVEF